MVLPEEGKEVMDIGRGGGFRVRFSGGRGGFVHFQDNVTTPAQVVEGGVMVGRDIIGVWEDDHPSGRRYQACGRNSCAPKSWR